MADTDNSEDKKRPPIIAPLAPIPQGTPAIAGGSVMPSLQPPTPQASRAAGKAEFERGLPSITAAPFTSDYYEQRQARNAYETAHPWGTDISAHPGTMGKVGHVLGRIGNVAADALVPRVAEMVPGSELNRAAQTAQNEQGFEKAQNAEDKLAIAANKEETSKELADERAQEAQLIQNLRGTQATDLQNQKGTQASALENQKIQGQEDINTQKPKPEKAVTIVLPNGQKAPGKTTQEGDILLADGTAAPTGTMLYQQPNYGQEVLPTKTIQILGPNGIPTVMGWNTKTQQYDIPQGTSSSGSLGHELGQAAIVNRAADTLIGDIQQNPESVGNVKAIIESAFLNTPLADPTQAKIAAEIGGFAALNPSMHGFRGQQALEQFEKLIGGIPRNEKALISAIQGFKVTAHQVNPNLNTGKDLGPAPKEYKEGRTGTLPDGTKVIVKGGRIITQ